MFTHKCRGLSRAMAMHRQILGERPRTISSLTSGHSMESQTSSSTPRYRSGVWRPKGRRWASPGDSRADSHMDPTAAFLEPFLFCDLHRVEGRGYFYTVSSESWGLLH